MLQRWQGVGNTVSDLTGPRFAEMGVSQNSLHVSQVAQMRNLRCAPCLFSALAKFAFGFIPFFSALAQFAFANW